MTCDVQERRNESARYPLRWQEPARAARIAVRAATALVLAFVLATSAARPATPRRIEIVAKRYAFEPAEITVKKGETVELELTSADVTHGLRIRELGINLHVNKGKKTDFSFTPQVVGTFIGHCSVFCGSGHGHMTLTIHVVS